MKVLVAGASGAVGLPLVRQLRAAGHEVSGTTRSESGAERIRQAGGNPVICDALDCPALIEAVSEAAPEVVINQLTSLPAKYEPSKKGYYDATNRIRREGGDNLIAATAASGARRMITQSVAFIYALSGPGVRTETDPVDRSGPQEATLYHEQKALDQDRFETVVLRYGFFYGPGTWYGRDGHLARQVAARRLPVVGGGTGIFSFLHVEDAASAAVAALTKGNGIYNVTDDEPAPFSDWLPAYAEAIGAKPPRRVPFWLASLVAGKLVALHATRGNGASNAKFKAEVDWQPSIPSWRQGFREAL